MNSSQFLSDINVGLVWAVALGALTRGIAGSRAGLMFT
jgi:hypothetical protein